MLGKTAVFLKKDDYKVGVTNASWLEGLLRSDEKEVQGGKRLTEGGIKIWLSTLEGIDKNYFPSFRQFRGRIGILLAKHEEIEK